MLEVRRPMADCITIYTSIARLAYSKLYRSAVKTPGPLRLARELGLKRRIAGMYGDLDIDQWLHSIAYKVLQRLRKAARYPDDYMFRLLAWHA
jgi:hypothetical protein